jgi:hypothetical protein
MTERKAGPRGIGEETVRAKTGKSSDDWYAILDAFGAPAQGHTRSAKHLRDQHGVDPWWAQTLTVRYEWERGLRTE